jgi:nucleoside-diphosphate-sugar epimerase
MLATLSVVLAAAFAAGTRAAEVVCSAADGSCESVGPVLVAAATANTGSETVKALSAAGAKVRAMVRKLDDPRAAALAALPGVELVQGDFDDEASIAAALKGTTRALLVSGAFAYEQFERETLFIEAAAAAGVEAVVRIGTFTPLTKPGTKGAYGRTHHGIEAFADEHSYPVITLRPSWFLSNWLGSAEEAKTTGKISIPVPVDGPKDVGMLDPRDVGAAAGHILMLSSEKLKPFIAKRTIELHGPSLVNFADVAAALSRAVGYTITLQSIEPDAFVKMLTGFGLPRVFATSFLETYQQVAGVVPKGYKPADRSAWPSRTDELLGMSGWLPRFDVNSWAQSVKGAFAK